MKRTLHIVSDLGAFNTPEKNSSTRENSNRTIKTVRS
jgi:hypothetical protein